MWLVEMQTLDVFLLVLSTDLLVTFFLHELGCWSQMTLVGCRQYL